MGVKQRAFPGASISSLEAPAISDSLDPRPLWSPGAWRERRCGGWRPAMARMLRQWLPKRWSEFVALLSLSTTFFLFLQTRTLSYELSAERHRHTGDGEEASGDTGIPASATGHPRNLHRELNTAQEDIQYTKLDPMELNNTRKAKKDILFFNRVPKVGSQTTMEPLKSLSIKNKFHYHKDRTQKVETIKLTMSEEKWLSNLLDFFNPPSVYVKHVCFVNFTQFDMDTPIYVNLVRDPVERVISWYYYVRAPWYFVERKRAFPELPLPNPNWLRKDFDTCVRTFNQECQYVPGLRHDGFGDHRRQTMFFCGHKEDCTGFNTEIAMKKAMENVEKHYAVVGILEELNKTLTVLEHYVPRFFKGALNTYWNEVHMFSKINRNIYKPPVAESTKELVRKNFTREIEFFEFCKQRLHKQYLALNLNDGLSNP